MVTKKTIQDKKPANRQKTVRKNPKGDRLSAREKKFVDEMAKPDVISATDAAKKAGYTEANAGTTAHKILKKPKIQIAIEKRKEEISRLSAINPKDILGLAVRQAFGTVDDVLSRDGRFDIVKARKTGAIHLIKKLTFTETKYGTNIGVEMYAADAARQELGDYLGMKQRPRENDLTLKKLIEDARELAAQNNTKFEDEITWLIENNAALPQQIIEQLKTDYLH